MGNTDFQITVKRSGGSLHVTPEGNFDGNSAWQLVNFLHENCSGGEGITIDTGRLADICAFGCQIFKSRLNYRLVPAARITFQGKNGAKLAVDGSRVVTGERGCSCGCDGNCRNCRCKKRSIPAPDAAGAGPKAARRNLALFPIQAATPEGEGYHGKR